MNGIVEGMYLSVGGAHFLEWAGCLTGASGALLLALKNRWSGYGFVLFLVSNGLWMAFGVVTHADGLVTQQGIFMITSVAGIFTWLVKPRPVDDKDEEEGDGIKAKAETA